MNIDRKLVCAALGSAIVLSGCAIDPETGDFVQYEFGESVNQTMMAQVVDPDPEYDTLVPETSGENAADAIERYRNGTVKEPRSQSVRSATSGSGSN